MILRSELTTGEYARLTGQPVSTVRAKIARGDFPPGCVVRIGTSKHYRHARLLVARLIAAGYLPAEAAEVGP